MDWLQSLLESSTTPLLTAFLLGLLTALSPCPLTTNIAAIGVVAKQIDNRKSVFFNGLLYTLGRAVAYTLLGVVLIALLRGGSSLFGIQKVIGKYGEMALGPVLILFGVYMLLSEKITLPSFGFKGDFERLTRGGGLGIFLLGVLFALAFCPTSGMFYFGMLIPMSATASMGYFLPLVFAFGTALPVLLVAWILAFSAELIGRLYGHMQALQRWLNVFVAVGFIGIGIYYCITIYL